TSINNQLTNVQNNTSKKNRSKKSGRPLSPVCDNFKKTTPDKYGHCGAICLYCGQSWSRGKPLTMESHLALHCNKAPDHIVTFYLHEVAERVEKLALDDDSEDDAFINSDQKKKKNEE
ncbi:421_t:CDS:1, partial [Cetraspora pellucida]